MKTWQYALLGLPAIPLTLAALPFVLLFIIARLVVAMPFMMLSVILREDPLRGKYEHIADRIAGI